jgi:hypothetical protein
MPVVTSTLIGLALAGGGVGLQAFGQHKAGQGAEAVGKAQQAAANSEADLSDFNAGIAAKQGQDALERGAEQESKFRVQVRGMIGSQRAGFASGGVDVNTGSPLAVQADTAASGELDALTIRNNAMRQAWGYDVQSYDLRQKAAIERQTGVMQAEAGEEAASSADIGAAGTLLGGGGSLFLQRFGYGKSSVAKSNYGPLPKEMG